MIEKIITGRMSDKELSKWLAYCSKMKPCEDCAIFNNNPNSHCVAALMEEASNRLLRWSPNVNNEFFKERCE